MKKLLFIIFVFGCVYFCSCEGIYDKIGDHATEEIVYPGRLDTIVGTVGFERVELDFFYPPNRIRASQMKLGKAKNTVVEYDGKTLVFDSVCSWVSVPDLKQPKLYRIKVYTTDENGYKSVPQEIAIKPFVSSDYSYLIMAAPRITSSPWAAEMKWAQPSSVLLDYVSLTYKYKDKNNEEHTGICEKGKIPVFELVNLDPNEDYSVEVSFRVIPKADGINILDTTSLVNNYTFKTPTAETYQKNLKIREFYKYPYPGSDAGQLASSTLNFFNFDYNWTTGNLTVNWADVTDGFMQNTTVEYMSGGVQKTILVQNTDVRTVLQGFDKGTKLKIRSNYAVVGVPGAFIDSFDFEIDPFFDLARTGWKCIYTSVKPINDGFPSGTTNPGTDIARAQAHLDDNPKTSFGLAKEGKTGGGSDNTGKNGTVPIVPSVFVIDMQTVQSFNYLRIIHRTADRGDGLRIWALQLLGTNDYKGPMEKFADPTVGSDKEDPTAWEIIASKITFPLPRTVETPMMFFPKVSYRYVKVYCTEWHTSTNNVFHLSEFFLGITSSNY